MKLTLYSNQNLIDTFKINLLYIVLQIYLVRVLLSLNSYRFSKIILERSELFIQKHMKI